MHTVVIQWCIAVCREHGDPSPCPEGVDQPLRANMYPPLVLPVGGTSTIQIIRSPLHNYKFVYWLEYKHVILQTRPLRVYQSDEYQSTV